MSTKKKIILTVLLGLLIAVGIVATYYLVSGLIQDIQWAVKSNTSNGFKFYLWYVGAIVCGFFTIITSTLLIIKFYKK